MSDRYIKPQSDDTEQIGDATHRYKDTYFHKLHIGSGSRLDIYDSNGVLLIEIDDANGRFKLNATGATSGIRVDGSNSGILGNITIIGGEGKDAVLNLSADDDDDDPDSWQIKSQASSNDLVFGQWTGSAYTERFALNTLGGFTVTLPTSTLFGLKVINPGTGDGIIIEQNGNADALNIDQAGSGYAIAITQLANYGSILILDVGTTTDVLSITSGAISGRAAIFACDSEMANTTDGFVFIKVDNSGSTGNALAVQNDGTGAALQIIQNGAAGNYTFEIDDQGTTENVIFGISAAAALTTGQAIDVDCSNSGFTSTFGLVRFTVNHVSATGHCLVLKQDGSGDILRCLDTATVAFAVHGDGDITLNTIKYTFPAADGVGTKILQTDGSGNLTWVTNLGGGGALNDLSDVTITGAGSGEYIRYSGSAWVDAALSIVDDTTPQLGGDLDMNTKAITSTGDTTAHITLAPAITDLNTTAVSIINSANHAGSGTGCVLQLTQDHASSAADVLKIQNDGTGNGVFIDQNGNGIALDIDSEATSVSVLNIDSIITNLNTSVVNITNAGNHAGSGSGAVLKITQDNIASAAATLLIKTDSSAGTAHALRLLDGSLVTRFYIQADGNTEFSPSTDDTTAVKISAAFTTTGIGLHVYNNTSSPFFTNTTDALVFIELDHSSTTGHALKIQQDGTGYSLYIDHNGNSPAIVIDSESTNTATVINIDVACTSGTVIDIALEGIFTGKAINITSSTATSGDGIYIDMSKSDYAGDVATFICNGANATGRCLVLQNDGTGNGFFLDQNENGIALNIDSEATTVNCINIDTKVTTGNAIDITCSGVMISGGLALNIVANSATSGSLASFTSTSITTGNALTLSISTATASGLILNVLAAGASNTATTAFFSNSRDSTSCFSLRVQGASAAIMFSITGSGLITVGATALFVLTPRAQSGTVEGTLIYNTATNKLNFYDGGSWRVVTST